MSFAFDSTSQFPRARDARSPSRHQPSWGTTVRRLVGRWLGRSAKQRSEPTAPVQRSWAEETGAMVAAGEAMLQRCRRENVALSVAVFDLTDLPELKSVFGSQVAQEVIARITVKFQRMATNRGLVVRTGPTVFAVLLPGFGRDRALSTIRSVMGHPCRIELEDRNEEVVLIPEFKVLAVRGDTASIEEAYTGLRRDISQAHTLELQRRKYLQRERESHTRLIDLLPDPVDSADSQPKGDHDRSASTIPTPLGSRTR